MMPRNCQLVRMKLLSKKTAKILGRLAKEVIQHTEEVQADLIQRSLKMQKQVQYKEDVLMDDDDEGQLMKDEENDRLEEQDDLKNYREVEVQGIFVKHDFDHIILDEDEIEKYTNGNLTFSTMKQTMQVPFEYDVQVLLYFLHSHFPQVETSFGQDPVQATFEDHGMAAKEQGRKASHDIKIVIGRTPTQENEQADEDSISLTGITISYFYSQQKLLLQWISSPRNDSLCDSICLLILQINE